jgi:dephospho-CoA kinase
MILGMTGGMGCGKSTAAKLFEEFGYQRIDSDALIRDVILREVDVIAAARAAWGNRVIGPDGQIDRRRLAEVVFADDTELARLESWLHPRLFARWRKLLHSPVSEKWVVEVPLLFEKQLENWFDFIVCVASSADVQLTRLSERGIPHALAGQRISKQWPLARKQELSDMVIWNDGYLSFLREQVALLDQRLSHPPVE